jgi:hypothetical protein
MNLLKELNTLTEANMKRLLDNVVDIMTTKEPANAKAEVKKLLAGVDPKEVIPAIQSHPSMTDFEAEFMRREGSSRSHWLDWWKSWDLTKDSLKESQFKNDTGFYVDELNNGSWGVFGNKSAHCYAKFKDEEAAEHEMIEMQKNLKRSATTVKEAKKEPNVSKDEDHENPHHFGFMDKKNAGRARQALKAADMDYEEDSNGGIRYFYFGSKKDLNKALRISKPVIDATKEEGEWGSVARDEKKGEKKSLKESKSKYQVHDAKNASEYESSAAFTDDLMTIDDEAAQIKKVMGSTQWKLWMKATDENFQVKAVKASNKCYDLIEQFVIALDDLQMVLAEADDK